MVVFDIECDIATVMTDSSAIQLLTSIRGACESGAPGTEGIQQT